MSGSITSMPSRKPGESEDDYHIRSSRARLVDRESWYRAHLSKSRSRHDKRATLKEAVQQHVQDGDIISDSGFTWVRGCWQAMCEILRQGRSNLSVVGSPMAVAGPLSVLGAAKYLHNSYVGAEMRGLDRMFSVAVKEKMVEIVSEWGHGAQALGFKAAQLGIPFAAGKQMLGSDMIKYNPYVKVMPNPLQENGSPVCLIPALYPDIVFIHVQQADKFGNARIWGPVVNDVALSVAARKVVITCEEIVPESDMRNNQSSNCIPFLYVDAVVELPFGAVPGMCPGHYYWNREWWEKGVRIMGRDRQAYLQWADKYVYSCRDQFDFVDKIGGGSRHLINLRKLTLAAEGVLEPDNVDYGYDEVTASRPAWRYPWETDFEAEKARLLEQIDRLLELEKEGR